MLIVDDDPAIRDLLVIRLGVLGHETRSAADGEAALSRIAEFRPQAMLLDINMPRLDGFGVLGRLGAEGARRLPTLVLTARHALEDVSRAVQMGARDYLAKPFEDRILLVRVSRLLRNT